MIKKNGANLISNLKKDFQGEVDQHNLENQIEVLNKQISSLNESIKFYQRQETSLKQDIYQLKVLGEIKQAVLMKQSPKEFAETAFHYLKKIIPYDHASVILFDLERETGNVLASYHGARFGVEPGFHFPLSECFDISFDLKQEGIQLDPSLLYPRSACLMEQRLSNYGIQSFLSFLLISHNKVIGTLNIASCTPDAFNDVYISIARDVADSFAIAIQKATLFEQTRLKAKELELLARFSSDLRQAETWNNVMSIMIQKTMEAMQASAGAFICFEDDRIIYYFAQNTLGKEFTGEYFQDSNHPIWHSFDHRKPIIIPEPDPVLYNFLPVETKIESIALFPVKMADVDGLLYLAFSHECDISVEDQRLLTSMIDIAENAMYRANVLETLENRVTNRTKELATLYDIASTITKPLEISTVLEQVLESILKSLEGSAGSVLLLDKTNQLQVCVSKNLPRSLNIQNLSVFQKIVNQRESLLIPDLRKEPIKEINPSIASTFPAFIGIPIQDSKQVFGVLSLFSCNPSTFGNHDLSLLISAADHISIALQNSKLREQAQEAIVIEERQRLARELHDSISQLLYSQVLFAEAGQKLSRKGAFELVPHYMSRLAEISSQAFKEMRLMIYALRPSVLESEGLVGALQHRLVTVEKRAGIGTKLEANESLKLPANVEDGLFRIAQEALNNTLKHASATFVQINLKRENDIVLLEIVDNGIGFDPENVVEGIGFCSQHERAKQLGGDLLIQSVPGEGTKVTTLIPIPETDRLQ